MLYFGSRRELRLRQSPSLSLEVLSEKVEAVREHVGREYVYFVGAHTGCSCGFPHVKAEEEFQYYDGMFEDEGPSRADDLASVGELLGIIDEAVDGRPDCVLFPVWDGSEGTAPKGEVVWHHQTMSPERIVLTEQFRYTIVPN
jgi:hypothetical protein